MINRRLCERQRHIKKLPLFGKRFPVNLCAKTISLQFPLVGFRIVVLRIYKTVLNKGNNSVIFFLM